MHQTIGTSIRCLRQQRNLTQTELAQLLDVSDDTVRRWESGTLAPELSLIPKLAFHLHTEPEALTGSVSDFSRQARPSVSTAAPWLSLMPTIVGFLAAVFLNWMEMPLYGFFAGGVLIGVGILVFFRRPSSRWVLLTELILFSALLPLVLNLQAEPSLPALRWLTYGTAFAAIAAIACASVCFMILAERKAIGETLRIYLRYGLILLAVLFMLGLLHFFVQYFLSSSQLLHSDSISFDNWDDFRNYMQNPLSSDGINTMTLLSIEESGSNLIYRFSDPNKGIVAIRDAIQTIPSPVGGDDLCTYLHLNQFVYSFALSSQGNLPVKIITFSDHLRAQQVLRTVNIVFILLYLAAAGSFIYFLYRKKREATESKSAA